MPVMRIVWKIDLKRLPNAMKPMDAVCLAVKEVITDFIVRIDVALTAERIRLLTFRLVTKKMEHVRLAATIGAFMGQSATTVVTTFATAVTVMALAEIVDMI